MKSKRGILLFLYIFICCVYPKAQIAVKSNMASDALLIPNLGIEAGISPKLTMELSAYYNPWKYSDTKQYKILMLQPELKYWLCSKFNGHYFGAHLLGGAYNVMGVKPPFALWSDMKDYRYKGKFYGAGVSYGYQYMLSRHWNVGASVGVGYAYVKYKKYPCIRCSQYTENSKKNYFGPTKAAVNLIYLF